MIRKILFDSQEVVHFFKSNGSLVPRPEGDYVYMPFWFRIIDDQQMEFINWDRLPKDIRDHVLNTSPKGLYFTKYPRTEDESYK